MVCRQLGFSDECTLTMMSIKGPVSVTNTSPYLSSAVAIPLTSSYFGGGVGIVHATSVFCDGTEESLVNCSLSRFIPRFGCTHRDDAGVICEGREKGGCVFNLGAWLLNDLFFVFSMQLLTLSVPMVT